MMILFYKVLIPFMVIIGSVKFFDHIYLSHILLLLFLLVSYCFRLNQIQIPIKLFLIILTSILYIFCVIFLNFELNAVYAAGQLIIFLIAIFIPVILYGYKNSLEIAIESILFGLLINSLFGIFEAINWLYNFGPTFIANGIFFRITGLNVSPSDFVISSLTGLLLNETVKNKKIYYLSLFIFILSALFSLSRIGILLVMFFLIIRISLNNSLQRYLKDNLIFLIPIILITIFLFSSYLLLISDRFFDIFNINYNIQRILIFNDILNKTFSNVFNFLIGHGFANYQYKNIVINEIYENPHNVYLYLLYNCGLIGTSLIVSSIYLVYRTGSINLIKSFSFFKSYQICIFFYCILAMVDTVIISVFSSWLIGYVLGIGLLTESNSNEDLT